MNSKPFYLSKTFWSLVITFAISVWNGFLAHTTNLPTVPDWVLGILATLGLYYRWNASGPLTLKRESSKDSDGVAKNPTEDSTKTTTENTTKNTTESNTTPEVKQDKTNILPDDKEKATEIAKQIDRTLEVNKLENKSYYLANKVGTKEDFLKLPESEQILDPEAFRKKYVPVTNADKNTKPVEAAPVQSVNSDSNDQKNILLNKIYFLLEKCGTKKDFEALPNEMQKLPKDLFKEHTKDICPEKK